jgi:hypothetical protein
VEAVIAGELEVEFALPEARLRMAVVGSTIQ